MSNDPIKLTDEQKALITANVKTKTLGELTALVFPGCKADGRTNEGRAIKAFIADVGETATTSATPIGPVELTAEQKQMIDSLVKGDRVKSSLELAKLVFQGTVVKKLSREWRAVYAYVKELYPATFDVTEEPVVDTQYQPPNQMQHLIALVNRYVTTGDNQRAYNPNALRVSDERNLKALMGYVHEYSFCYYASTYQTQVDRDLFISTFVRWAHDKPDLTEIECDQMVQAAVEKVNIAQMGREIENIRQYHQSVMAGDEVDPTGKVKRFGMTEVEQISQTRLRWDAAKGRLEKLMETLEGSRSKRLAARDTRNSSILNLFDAWRGDPEWRASLLALGQREKAEDAAEVKRLKEMDDVIALVSGQSEEEASA